MGRLGACRMFAVVLAMCFAAHASAASNTDCKLDMSGYSSFFGAKASGAKFVDHSRLVHLGPVKAVSLFYSKSAGCLRGAKVVVAGTTNLPGVVGTSVSTNEISLKLSPGEFVNKAEVKADKCIEYIKLFTNKGRSAAAGVIGASAQSSKVAPPAGGRLVSIRGFQTTNALREADPNDKAQETQPAPAPVSEPAKNNTTTTTPSSSKTAKTSSNSTTTTTTASSSSSNTSGSSGGSTSNASIPAAAAPAPPAAKNTDPTKCPSKIDMCNEKASMNQFSYCIWNSPFTKSACKGGCCFSSGKCASSSCTLSGMGRDVANMICYGTNTGVGFGGTNMCAGLACKLANPGCTTDAFGGNCVGTVVPFGSKDLVSHDARKYIGAACLDATPSDTTLDVNGHPAENKGIYMGKLWTICDCSDQEAVGPDLAATFVNFTTTGLNNVTKNDVMLAVSQLLPKINLTDILKLDDGKEEGKELFPSITDLFQFPQLPTITMPGFLGSNSSNGSAPVLQLPNLQGLLSQFATKISSSSSSSSSPETTTPASAAAATPESAPATLESAPAAVETSAASSGTPAPAAAPAATNSSEGDSSNPLAGIKNLLSSILPVLQAITTNTTASTNTDSSGPSAAGSGKQVAEAPSIQDLLTEVIGTNAAPEPAAKQAEVQPAVDSQHSDMAAVISGEGQGAPFKITI